MNTGFDNETTRIEAEILVDDETGVTFIPVAFGGCIGYRVDHPDGRFEYVVLAPSTWHQYNPDNGAEGDTFLYQLRSEDASLWGRNSSGLSASIVDFADAITYVNHFEKE